MKTWSGMSECATKRNVVSREKMGKVGVFTSEIEKDVHRFLSFILFISFVGVFPSILRTSATLD